MIFELDEGGIYRLVPQPSSTTADTCSFSEFTYGGTWFCPPIGDPIILDMSKLSEREVDLLLDNISETHGIGKLCFPLVMFDSEQIEPYEVITNDIT